MKKKSHSLSIMLLKSDIVSGVDALKAPSSIQPLDIDIKDAAAQLYYKQTKRNIPSWVKLFKPFVGTELDNLGNSSTSAVLFVPCSSRIFAITFGYGRSLLKPECYEENFGLRVVLNAVDPDKLRSVDAQSLDAVPVHRRSQASVATNLGDFGFNTEQDIMYAATGCPKDSSFGKQITGKDAIKVSIALDLNDLSNFLGKLLQTFNLDTYKERFGWVDNLAEVRDPALIVSLDQALENKIASGDLAKTWLAVPDVMEWADFGGFRYQQPKRGETRDDIDWPSYLEFICDSHPKTVETFKKHSVFRISQSSGMETDDWSLYKCIYCELALKEDSFALNNGKWYRINADFLGALNTAISSIPVSTLNLLNYSDGDEGLYNERVHEGNKNYYALMDKKMIGHGGGHSQIEFCDLYSADKHLIHVKRYGGSSVLSHLFAQGCVSAQLFLSDSDFRAKVNEVLPPAYRLSSPEEKPNAGDFEVVYAIASNSKTGSLDLPLFSKINLRNCYRQLDLVGMRCSLKMIPVCNNADEMDASA